MYCTIVHIMVAHLAYVCNKKQTNQLFRVPVLLTYIKSVSAKILAFFAHPPCGICRRKALRKAPDFHKKDKIPAKFILIGRLLNGWAGSRSPLNSFFEMAQKMLVILGNSVLYGGNLNN